MWLPIVSINTGNNSSKNGGCCSCNTPSSKEILFETEVWFNWKDVNDHYHYYTYKANSLHSVLCVQHPDKTGALNIDLHVDKATKRWKVRICNTYWRPGNRKVSTTKNKWHLAALLKAVKASTDEFGEYSPICNNCNTWIEKITTLLNDEQKMKEFECKPVTADYGKLMIFARELGVELRDPRKEDTQEMTEYDFKGT